MPGSCPLCPHSSIPPKAALVRRAHGSSSRAKITPQAPSGCCCWLLITAQSPSLHENISEAWSGNTEKALVSHSTSKYVAYNWTDSQGLGRFPWWFNYTKLVTELLCACSEMSAGWDPWKSLNWFIQNTIEKNFSYTKWSLIEEDIRHKLEIALENFFFCWNIKEGFVQCPWAENGDKSGNW